LPVSAARKITHTRKINEKQDAYLILHIYFLRGTSALYISKRDKTGLREKCKFGHGVELNILVDLCS